MTSPVKAEMLDGGYKVRQPVAAVFKQHLYKASAALNL